MLKLSVRRCLLEHVDDCIPWPQDRRRKAWEMAYGTLPRGLLVLQECSTKRCINPRHLLAGNARHRAEAMNGERDGNRTRA